MALLRGEFEMVGQGWVAQHNAIEPIMGGKGRQDVEAEAGSIEGEKGGNGRGWAGNAEVGGQQRVQFGHCDLE
jgi:hypothetical protein